MPLPKPNRFVPIPRVGQSSRCAAQETAAVPVAASNRGTLYILEGKTVNLLWIFLHQLERLFVYKCKTFYQL